MYREGDDAQLLALFNSVFGSNRSADEWNWKYHDPDRSSAPQIVVAESSGQIVGMYPALRVRLSVRGDIVTAFQPVDNAVLPHFRNGLVQKGLVRRHQEETLRVSPITFGFPGIRHFRLGLKTLGYEDLGSLPQYELRGSFAAHEYDSLDSVREISSLEPFEFGIEKLARHVAEIFPVSTLRDVRYLNHRYLLHPARKFSIFGFFDGLQLLGIVVTNCQQSRNSVSSVTVYDLFGVDREEVAAALLAKASQALLQKRTGSVLCWYKGLHTYARALQSLGFVPTDVEHFRAACLYPRDGRDSRLILDPNSWLFTLGDTDL